MPPIFISGCFLFKPESKANGRKQAGKELGCLKERISVEHVFITLAKTLRRSSSSLSSQNVASSSSSCRVGGVVISKKRVSNARNEHAGNFSCGSQLFVTPAYPIQIKQTPNKGILSK